MQTIGRHSGDVSLYVHIPFCSKKCPYCHFFVLPDQDRLKQQFLKALVIEWQMRLPQLQGKRIVSIYFGGGTPSRLKSTDLVSFLEQILSSGLEIAEDCEITIEVNPEDVTPALMSHYYNGGINRVSLGIQSLDDGQLNLLQRQHGAQKGIKAIEQVYASGIENISIDLMYDLPLQSLSNWKGTLERLQTLPITHLSLYNLTFEPHTGFFQRQKELSPLLPSQELSLQLLQEAILSIEELGLQRYEISAFAKPGCQSRHNVGYWTARPFLGFGPSAFSYWEGKRWSNVAHLNRYAQGLVEMSFPVDFTEELPYPQNLSELFAVQLRLKAGVDLVLFQQSYGAFPESFTGVVSKLIEKGWMEREGDRCSLTEQGMLFYDSIAVEIIGM